jgi:hypothetical protein
MRTDFDTEVLPAIILTALTVYKGTMAKFKLFSILNKFSDEDKQEALMYLFDKQLVFFEAGQANGDCMVEMDFNF